MNENELIDRANSRGLRTCSANNIKELWTDAFSGENRVEDLVVFVENYDVDLPAGLTERLVAVGDEFKGICAEIRSHAAARRDAKDFVTYRD